MWRCHRVILAIALGGCASTAAPVPAPSGPGQPVAAPSPAVALSPVHDPVCTPEAAGPPDPEPAATAGDPVPAAPDDDAPKRVARPTNACSLTSANIARDEAAILALRGPRAPIAPRSVWNHKTTPARLDLIERRFALAAPELAQLQRTGVIVPARLEAQSYTYAYHEIFESQLPVYISADSIFHAIFASHDTFLASIETASLGPALSNAFDRMHCALPAASADYTADTARDLDLYLTVARSLFADAPVKSIRGDAEVDRWAGELLAKIAAGAEVQRIELFGRPRLVDFTQYTPRGHYTKSDELKRYFVAAMWASRLELNLVSRSSRSSAPGPEPDPSETPREAIDALALADLATRSHATPGLATVDQAWALLTGRREDVSIGQLQELRAAAHITSLAAPTAFAQLKQAIGDQFQRTVRMHPMPEGSTVLPAIATLIGPRVVADAQALMPLVASAVPDRQIVHAADMVYSLGLDRARRYLADDLAAFPQLAGQLDVARKLVQAAPVGDDLYGAWFAAIRGLAVTPVGALPSFATTDAGADLRFNSIATAYGQLKHNYVLMAGQTYSDFGCEIPDGYIEPALAAYDALIEYAVRGGKLAAVVDSAASGGAYGAYFARVERTLRVIRSIAADELANRPLTTDQKRWIGMVTELSVDDSENITGYPPVYSGWYFDLFPDAQDDGMRGAEFIADYFTSVDKGISYVGASAPRLAIFVVDTGGAPRAFVGPVARGFEAHTPIGARLTDHDAGGLAHVDEPWAASYTIANPATRPRLDVRYDPRTGDVIVKGDPALGPVTITLLDHHRVPLATRRQTLGAEDTVFAFHRTSLRAGMPSGAIGAVYVQVGAFRDWIVGDSYHQIQDEWGKPAEPDSQ